MMEKHVYLLDYERKAIAYILPSVFAEKLLHNAIVAEREFSGAGFFTTFRIPGMKTKIRHLKQKVVKFEVGKNKSIIGFVMFDTDKSGQYILEGFTYDQSWPEFSEYKVV